MHSMHESVPEQERKRNMSIRFSQQYAAPFVRPEECAQLQPMVNAAHELLISHSGAGSDFLGWTTLPEDYDRAEFARIKAAAERIRKSCQVFIAIGIGGSYLGARAACARDVTCASTLSLSPAPRPSLPWRSAFSVSCWRKSTGRKAHGSASSSRLTGRKARSSTFQTRRDTRHSSCRMTSAVVSRF